MATELTNKFNEAVNIVITAYFTDNGYTALLTQFIADGGYRQFSIVYNNVGQKLWFGNKSSGFILTNSTSFIKDSLIDNIKCQTPQLPDYSSWGLPGYLGFTRCPTTSLSVNELLNSKTPNIPDSAISPNLGVPRFYYGEAVMESGDNGYWLLPGAPGATVYFLQAPLKISFMGPSYIYMEVDGMNCIDEISPWNLSQYTAHTNQTNGIVNSSFAKIPVPTTPISQWFDDDMGPYKYWNPPAERISKFKFKFRYHNGQLVDFGNFTYSFMLELNMLRPQQERSYSIRNASDLGQIQGFSSKFI